MAKLGVALLCAGVLCLAGCSPETSNLPPLSPDDTTGQGGGGGGAGSLWVLVGPVTFQSGVLTARNSADSSGDVVVASATLRRPVDHGDVEIVTYTWQESVTRQGTYSFWVGADTSDLQSIPFTDRGGGRKQAQVAFMLSFTSPLYARFLFTLAPAERAVISGFTSRAGQ